MKKIEMILLLMATLGITNAFLDSKMICHSGTYLVTPNSGPEICDECKDGFFNPYNENRNKSCLKCSSIVDPLVEVLVGECTITHNAEILCIDGFYRRRAKNHQEPGRCIKCLKCDNHTISCHGYQDAVCLEEYVTDQYNGSANNIGTSADMITCGQGEYVFTDFNKSSCRRCTNGTYNDALNHSSITCKNCSEFNDGQQPALCQIGYDDHSCSNLNTVRNVNLVTICVLFINIFLIMYLKLNSTTHGNIIPVKINVIFWLTFAVDIFVCMLGPILIFSTSFTHVQADSCFSSIFAVCLFLVLIVVALMLFFTRMQQNNQKIDENVPLDQSLQLLAPEYTDVIYYQCWHYLQQQM